MKISERQKVFLKALHAAFGDTEISTRAINIRLAGGALKDPVNTALLQAIVGCIGRKIHSTGVGRLLEKVRGRRIGDVELVCDGEEKRAGKWYYYIKDYAAPITPAPDLEKIRREAEANSEAWVDRMMALPPSKREPAIQAQLNREERAKLREQQEADKAKVLADPETAAIWRSVKRGQDGRPEPVEVLPPPPAAPVAEPKPAAVHINTTPATKADNRLPPWTREGRQPTKAELAERHENPHMPARVYIPAWVQEQRHPEPVELIQWQREVAYVESISPPTVYDLARRGNGVGDHQCGNGSSIPNRTSTIWSRHLKDL